MTVVLEHRSGKVEIVSFVYGDAYPQRVRVRTVVVTDHDGTKHAERLFHRQRWLRGGRPLYVEEEPPTPPGAA